MNPNRTCRVDDNIYSIRHWDVNFWLYKKGRIVIAIDERCRNFPNAKKEIEKLGINIEDIRYVFITYADIEYS